jgi:LacI family transcriptional regulator
MSDVPSTPLRNLPRSNRKSAGGLLRIAVLLDSSRAFGRGILHGIAECLHDFRHWLMYYQEGAQGELLPEWFDRWEGDGVIARIEDDRMAQTLVRKGIPTVDIRGVCPVAGVPVVKTDNHEIARFAAEHLLGCGLKAFAYCGYAGAPDSEQRREAFVQLIRHAGFECHVFDGAAPSLTTTRARELYAWMHEDELARWLSGLPKPIGVMAANDVRGHQVLNLARLLGVPVPDELAVVGVDNFEMICELGIPPLSSVEQDTRQIGAAAVRLLETMLRGKRPPSTPLLVKPRRVVARRSTDALAIPDPRLRQAVRCIRNYATSGVGVADVAKSSGLSRRELERHFRAAFGHSPGQEIVNVQIQAIKSLLIETDEPIYRIAEKCGFAYPEYLNVMFKRHTGMTPRKYRLQVGRGTLE